MGSRDAAKALAEGQRAARNAIPAWDRVTLQANPKDSPCWPREPDSKKRGDLTGWLCAPYPNRIGKIASRSRARTKSAPAIRANEKTGATYHSGQ